MKEYDVCADDIEHVVIKTFRRATLLSKIEPKTADEAQYNIAYPVAASLVYGDFGLMQVREENLHDAAVLDMMKRLSFAVDEGLDARFPAERICRAEIVTKDGRKQNGSLLYTIRPIYEAIQHHANKQLEQQGLF